MTLHKHDTTPYSNREIDSKYREILTGLNRIELQTKETNGRLLAQAKESNDRFGELEQWRAYVTGSITILGIIVLPLSFWVLKQTIAYRELLVVLEI